jgi:hypothetical protein
MVVFLSPKMFYSMKQDFLILFFFLPLTETPLALHQMFPSLNYLLVVIIFTTYPPTLHTTSLTSTITQHKSQHLLCHLPLHLSSITTLTILSHITQPQILILLITHPSIPLHPLDLKTLTLCKLEQNLALSYPDKIPSYSCLTLSQKLLDKH